jgi:hypothetical protein
MFLRPRGRSPEREDGTPRTGCFLGRGGVGMGLHNMHVGKAKTGLTTTKQSRVQALVAVGVLGAGRYEPGGPVPVLATE